MQKRPVALTVFGILNIAFGVLGFLGAIISGVVTPRVNGNANPFLQQLHANPMFNNWLRISSVFAVVASALVLVAGIGLLFMKNWARILSIIYSIYAIIAGLVGGMVMVLAISQIMPSNAREGWFLHAAIIAGSFIGMLAGMIYPILLLIFMLRPYIVAVCKSSELLPPP